VRANAFVNIVRAARASMFGVETNALPNAPTASARD
jgi:hypothetical protein